MKHIALLIASLITTNTHSTTISSPENHIDVFSTPGTISVTAHKGWHINEKFPWKATTSTGLVHVFKFFEDSAVASGIPDGVVVIKGGVCNESQCSPFKINVVVPMK